jgi:hypothetical protein
MMRTIIKKIKLRARRIFMNRLTLRAQAVPELTGEEKRIV